MISMAIIRQILMDATFMNLCQQKLLFCFKSSFEYLEIVANKPFRMPREMCPIWGQLLFWRVLMNFPSFQQIVQQVEIAVFDLTC